MTELPRSLLKAIQELANESEVRELQQSILAALETIDENGTDFVEMDLQDTIAITNWQSGVEEYQAWTTKDLYEGLGLKSDRLPLFQEYVDPTSSIDGWSDGGQAWLRDDTNKQRERLQVRWHQWVGIYKMIDQYLNGLPVLLMDGVGLGKTIQALGFIVVLNHFHEYHKRMKCFPGKFGEFC